MDPHLELSSAASTYTAQDSQQEIFSCTYTLLVNSKGESESMESNAKDTGFFWDACN